MILIVPKRTQKIQLLPSSIQLNGCNIPVYSVRNLGVTLDKTLSFQQHIYTICVRFAILNSVESVLSVTISLMMLSELSSVILFCFVLITIIHFLLGALKIWL